MRARCCGPLSGLFSLVFAVGCHKTVSSPAPTAPPTVIRFRETASAAGLAFSWTAPGKRPLNILQTIGNGCAFLDFNNDGNLDILLVGPRPALYQGDGHGHFTDRSALLGGVSGYFLGVAVGDTDNDGFVDLYLSGYREGRLLHNNGGKGFQDITAAQGLKPQPWGTACGFADLDGDGFLDLYVANYAQFSPTTQPQLCKFKTQSHGEVLSSCGPNRYIGLRGVLWHNRGGKGFTDITQAAGFSTHNGRGLGVAFGDIDGSGTPSVALANDEAPGDLFSARGGGKFENTGQSSGVATDAEGKVHGGMGIDWADYDNDGKLDLFVATFRNEVKNLYHNEGEGLFIDRSYAVGIGQAALPYVAFGCKFLDADNDGWLDLIITNGHVQDNIELIENTTYRQKTLFLQNQKGHFVDAGSAAGIDRLPSIVGRGLAVGDYDNDGRMDALIVDSEGKPLLLHNETPITPESWVGFVCKEANGRDAYGAVLTIHLSGGATRVRQCQTAGSYLSASDPRVHFGLGGSKIESLTVRWPGGKTETWSGFPTGRYLTLQPGKKPF